MRGIVQGKRDRKLNAYKVDVGKMFVLCGGHDWRFHS
jgi:hypothetical protein